MTTTIILLLVLIESARLALQWWSYKKYGSERDKTYCAPYEVENFYIKVKEEEMKDLLVKYGKMGYELVCAEYCGFYKASGCRLYTLFFTKKKIKNFKED